MYKAIVVGVSTGGLDALMKIIPALSADFPVPIIVVQHLPDNKKSTLSQLLNNASEIKVLEANEKQKIIAPAVYIAPAGYHLLVEDDLTFSLDEGVYVNFSRPSIDVLFESAASVFKDALIALILTGANSDGSQGLQLIKSCGGYVVVQDPQGAASTEMIQSALNSVNVDKVVELDKIAGVLTQLVSSSGQN